MRESEGLPPGSRPPLPIMTRRPYSPLGVILALLLAVVVFALLPVPEGPLAYLVVIGGAVVLALAAGWMAPRLFFVYRHLIDAWAGRRSDRAPADYVARVFDSYAPIFDRHLRDELDYRAPELLREAVGRHIQGAGRVLRVVDLGCGTGLCGPLFRDLADRLTGVDLSPGMVERARARGVYDEVVLADLIELLQRERGWCDLLIAADVFCYVGDLAPVLVGAARSLRELGLFAFTVERGEGDDFALLPSGRFMHGQGYIRREAQAAGLEVLEIGEAVLRHEGRFAVIGEIYVLQRPAP
jgi:predicted TPR repeat methyltransferase